MSTQSSYAGVTSTVPVPSKEQAIILDSIDGCTIDDYLDGIEKTTELSNVRFISKISGNRVCIYLNNKEVADKLVQEKVIVNHTVLSVRPYIEKNKRVVISNVSPYIPHSVILQSLEKIGITVVSQMYHIKASTSKPGRAHIMSFRRQVYVKEEDVHLLPESLQIAHDETTHWIFLSTESANCFICKQHGHIAKVCPTAPAIITDNNSSLDSKTTTEPGFKRPAASSLSSENSTLPSPYTDGNKRDSSIGEINNSKIRKPRAKRSKTTDEKTLDSQEPYSDMENSLVQVKATLDARDVSMKQLPLDYNKFAQFLRDSYGKADIIGIAATFTDDTDGLLEMLDLSYPLITENKLKARIARIKKKLEKANSELDSDLSSY